MATMLKESKVCEYPYPYYSQLKEPINERYKVVLI